VACTDHAYHGISEASAAVSPESWHGGERPDHVETWDPGAADGVAAALDRLTGRDLAAAAVILDGVLTSDGYPSVAAATAQRWLADTHAAGALWIADEVQGGHGRTGETLWSFARLGLVPDVVTLGKPMGNGHPVGAVVTRREIAATFAEETVFFSTFGGNPVSAAAALAVLDVIEDERVLARTTLAGAALRDVLRAAGDGDPRIVEVRGVGLAIGVQCRDATSATAIKEGMRGRGVLIGTTGRDGDVLKIRPPLAFSIDDVRVVGDAFAATLAGLPD
jgi:4-aminobutyrate aminotransferase-like enzyme